MIYRLLILLGVIFIPYYFTKFILKSFFEDSDIYDIVIDEDTPWTSNFLLWLLGIIGAFVLVSVTFLSYHIIHWIICGK